jgi:hypothetical protein
VGLVVNARASRECALALGAYGAYLGVRALVWNDRGRARAKRNASRVVAIEQRLGVAVEGRVQDAAMRVPRLVDVLNAGYAAGNVGLSVGWLIALYRHDDADFARERRAAIAAFLGALPLFALFPTAPPRTHDGFVDTLAERGVSIDHPFLVRFYNPIAAMPSHHVAFAVVTGVALSKRARTPAGRALWLGHPLGVAAVVVGTANHFVADVAAGALLGTLARRLTRERAR